MKQLNISAGPKKKKRYRRRRSFFRCPNREMRLTTLLINVLKITWLQFQTAQLLWPTQSERDYQGPRNICNNYISSWRAFDPRKKKKLP